jgi:CubicO group peptidase (beta-lactamase class C family)
MLDTKSIDECIKKHMSRHNTPALALVLTDHSDTLHLKTFGFSNLEARRRLTPNDLFEIGSIGKTFTAVAVMQAFERGEIELDAPVTEYLPWFKVRSRYNPITTHHLLTHTSGLIEGTDFTPDGRAEVWALRETETGFPPGTRFHYSNVGYKVLGLALEAASGSSYPDILRTRILEPLEMDDSRPQITHTARVGMARGYQPLFDDRPIHPSQYLYPAPWLETNTSDGSVASTAPDMAKFARMLLNRGCFNGEQVLSEKSFDLMMTCHIAQAESWFYGYGLDTFTYKDYAHIGHAGDMPGYEAFMWLDMDNNLACIMLMTQPYPPGISLPVLDYLRAAQLGQKLPDLPQPPDPFKLEERDPSRYSGVYKKIENKPNRNSPSGNSASRTPVQHSSTIVFKAESDRLLIVDLKAPIPLEPRGEDKFYTSHPDYDRFPFQFKFPDAESTSQEAIEVFWGPNWFISNTYLGPTSYDTPPAWEAFSGHYRSHNPWGSNFRVFERKGELILAWPSGKEELLHQLGENIFREGEQTSPERISFDWITDSQALRARRSGCDYYRFFTP